MVECRMVRDKTISSTQLHGVNLNHRLQQLDFDYVQRKMRMTQQKRGQCRKHSKAFSIRKMNKFPPKHSEWRIGAIISNEYKYLLIKVNSRIVIHLHVSNGIKMASIRQ